MTQKEKDLLLKDLCARLPYGVKGLVTFNRNPSISKIQEDRIIDGKLYDRFAKFQDSWYDNVTIKPYLFPLSSMTEEQKSYLYFNTKFDVDRFGCLVVKIDEDDNYFYTDISDYTSLIDWLNKNNFDYRGLIEKGLAIDATGLNIY